MPSPSETTTGPESGVDRPNWKVVEIHGSDEGGEFSEFLLADRDASEGAILRREEAVYGQVADALTADIIVKAVNTWPDLVARLAAIADFPVTSPNTNLDAANMAEIARQALVSVGARS